MSTSAKPITVWSDQPRRTGLAWFRGNVARLLHLVTMQLLTRFIGLLGAISVPGMKPVGVLQAWALRRMGVKCGSPQVWIGADVSFDYPGHVVLGKRVVIGPNSRITARDQIVIGDDFLSAPGLVLTTGTHDPATLVPQSSPIVIEEGVWCGTRVTVCPGVTIGRGAIIGAGSLVLHDVPPLHLAFGVPCKPQRNLEAIRHGVRPWSNFRES